MDVPTGHCPLHYYIWGIPNLYLGQPITKFKASQLEAMSHALVTVLLPPG